MAKASTSKAGGGSRDARRGGENRGTGGQTARTPGKSRVKAAAANAALSGPRPSDTLSKERLLEIYRWMLLTRRLEERLVHLYRQNQVVGGLYRSLGQEAETIGAVYALEKQDIIAPLIRNMGSVLVKGYRPRDVAMQYMARGGSPTQGKDLNIHFGSVPEPGVVSPVSMLGDLIPVMAGVALAAKLKKEDRVALTFIGDGGSSTGAFYEGLNLAAVWKLPLIVIVEHNQYAYSTPTSRQMAVEDIAEKAIGLGIDSEIADGNDPLAVYDAVVRARRRAVAGEGPTLIEVKTYRRKGHAEHDMQKYVPHGEIGVWEKKDPMDRYESYLKSEHKVTQEELETIGEEIKQHLEEEFDAALQSPLPDPRIALENVYAIPATAEDFLAGYRNGDLDL